MPSSLRGLHRRSLAATAIALIAATLTLTTTTFGDDLPSARYTVAGLERPVQIRLDAHAIPTIRAERYIDAVFGQGFIHAQHRFFQMDGARRLAAGEAAALAGPALLDLDKQSRRYRFRDVARRIVNQLDDRERAILESFTAGVNAGLAHLDERPFEYSILQVDPQPWTVEDSILIALGMFDMLHMEGRFERRLGVMRDALPEELVNFLTPIATRFDALLIPSVVNGDDLVNDWSPAPIPGADIIDLRDRASADYPLDLIDSAPIALGSNNFAVAGARTDDGRAILANDPHLANMVPPVWYRAHLEWNDGRVIGLSLPGTPGIVVGSTDHIAWGITNMMGDFQDYIIIEVDPDDPSRYRTPDGYEPFREITETIEVRGRPAHTLTLRSTRWGVVIDEDHRDRPLVLRWTALEPEMVNFRVLDMPFARTLEGAVDVARNWYGPSQNILLASNDGRIAFAVSGYLPKRIGFSGRYPVSWADGNARWDGHIDEADRPVVIDPDAGILFTANNRTVPLDRARQLGGIWVAGTRAGRIGEMLNHNRRFDERDLLDLQLDTRLAVFDFYRDLLLDLTDRLPPDDELLRTALDIVRNWNGRADHDQPAVHLLDAYRREVHRRVLSPLIAPCRELDRTFIYHWFMDEEPLRAILQQQPAHLLPPNENSWDDMLLGAWKAVMGMIIHHPTRYPHGVKTPWGEVNRLRMSHPLSSVMPFLAERLDMPESPQPGHRFAVRVATPAFGASARLVVSPGRFDRAILHTPGGQSGNPQSPNYRDLHNAWLAGDPTPLLPARPTQHIDLVPGAVPAE